MHRGAGAKQTRHEVNSMIDFSALFSQLISTYWWLPLFALMALFKSAWFKGFIGEARPFSFDDTPGWPV